MSCVLVAACCGGVEHCGWKAAWQQQRRHEWARHAAEGAGRSRAAVLAPPCLLRPACLCSRGRATAPWSCRLTRSTQAGGGCPALRALAAPCCPSRRTLNCPQHQPLPPPDVVCPPSPLCTPAAKSVINLSREDLLIALEEGKRAAWAKLSAIQARPASLPACSSCGFRPRRVGSALPAWPDLRCPPLPLAPPG